MMHRRLPPWACQMGIRSVLSVVEREEGQMLIASRFQKATCRQIRAAYLAAVEEYLDLVAQEAAAEPEDQAAFVRAIVSFCRRREEECLRQAYDGPALHGLNAQVQTRAWADLQRMSAWLPAANAIAGRTAVGA